MERGRQVERGSYFRSSLACLQGSPARKVFSPAADRLSMVAKQLNHFVCISRDARSDIEWWYHFCLFWNGVSMMRSVSSSHTSVEVTSDASGSWGCGAFSGSRWFKLQWSAFLFRCSHISKGTGSHHHCSSSVGRRLAM